MLVQDGLQRAKQPTPEWTFFKYDGMNRPVMAGTFASASSRAALTTAVAASFTRDEQRTLANTVGYTLNRTYPTTATEADVFSITYYDDHGFLSIAGWSSYGYQAVDGYSGTKSDNVKGLVTGAKGRTVGENSAWLHSATYYDRHYRPLQTVSGHQQGGIVRTTSQYAFSGELEKTVDAYSHTGGTTRVERRFAHDHMGRPVKVYHRVDDQDEAVLTEVEYNALGQPHVSRHHSRDDGATWMYQTSTEHAIQGMLGRKGHRFPDGGNIFEHELGYHNALGTGNGSRYDGLISGNRWKHGDASPEGAYNYVYDAGKRLSHSNYLQKNGGAWTANNFFSENNILYDSNGNIQSLLRNREKSGAAAQIDNLAYSYSGNRLVSVADNAPSAHKADGFHDGNAGNDYAYNANGNLVTDLNKGITSIAYNRLDLPQRIDFSNGRNIRYTYSASGALLTVGYFNSGGSADSVFQYVGELVFKGSALTDINHELGRVLANDGHKYQYYLTDHLGSTRVVLQEDPADFTMMATFEADALEEESGQFLYYDEAVRIAANIFDHTGTGDSRYSIRLGGREGETLGPARSLSVMTGDTVRMTVYGKYIDMKEASVNPALMAIVMGIAGGTTAADGETAKAAGGNAAGRQGFAGLLGTKKGDGKAPPAYLNYLFFDRGMNFKYGGYVQMSGAAREDGSDVPHEKLHREVVAEEPGYF